MAALCAIPVSPLPAQPLMDAHSTPARISTSSRVKFVTPDDEFESAKTDRYYSSRRTPPISNSTNKRHQRRPTPYIRSGDGYRGLPPIAETMEETQDVANDSESQELIDHSEPAQIQDNCNCFFAWLRWWFKID